MIAADGDGIAVKFDHPGLPAVIALQVAGKWREALERLTALLQDGPVLLAEANRVICLHHQRRFAEAARLAPGIARLMPPELDEFEYGRLASSLLVVAMTGSHALGDFGAALRAAVAIAMQFGHRVAELPLVPTAVLAGPDGLVIHESLDLEHVVFVTTCLAAGAKIPDEQREILEALVRDYMRRVPLDVTVQGIFQRVLVLDDTGFPADSDMHRLAPLIAHLDGARR